MSRLEKWLQIGANVGILVGLALVVLQIRQSNELQRVEHVARSFELDMAHVLTQVGDDPSGAVAKAVFEPESMTHRDRVVYTGFLYYTLMLAERNAQLEREGLLDHTWRDVTLPRIAFYLGGSPIARAWWNAARKSYDPELAWVSELDTMVAATPDRIQQVAWGAVYDEALSTKSNLTDPD